MSFSFVPKLQAIAFKKFASKPWIQDKIMHPAGPFTIFFWAPTFKWALVIANIADMAIPVEKISMNQQAAVALTGCIWAKYSMVIIPKNYVLFAVNIWMAATGITQISRRFLWEQ